MFLRKRKLGRGVAVVGVGMTEFGVYPKGVRASDLFVEAFNDMKSSVDKGLRDEDIESFYIRKPGSLRSYCGQPRGSCTQAGG